MEASAADPGTNVVTLFLDRSPDPAALLAGKPQPGGLVLTLVPKRDASLPGLGIVSFGWPLVAQPCRPSRRLGVALKHDCRQRQLLHPPTSAPIHHAQDYTMTAAALFRWGIAAIPGVIAGDRGGSRSH